MTYNLKKYLLTLYFVYGNYYLLKYPVSKGETITVYFKDV